MALTETAGRLMEGARAQNAIAGLILINAVILGLETVPSVMAGYGTLLMAVDRVILAIFVVEIAIRIAYRRLAFFRDAWNWFDIVVIGIALVPATGPLSVLRTLRVLRVLRLLSVVPSMRKVIEALLTALPGIGSVASLILLIFYVSAVLTTNLFGADFPERFGSIGESMYSLFQIMTLENWSDGIARPVMEIYPAAWVFFVPFILITSFAVLNLFIGIIVDAMQRRHRAEFDTDVGAIAEDEAVILREIKSMHGQLAQLTDDLARLRRSIEAEQEGPAAKSM